MYKLLFSLVFISLVLGQAVRIPLTNSAILTPLDISVFLLMSAVFAKKLWQKKAVSWQKIPLFRPVGCFILACILSLLVNVGTFSVPELLIGSLYLFRWIAYACLYVVVLQSTKREKKFIFFGLITSGVVFTLIGFVQYFLYPNLHNLYYLQWDDHLYRIFSTLLDPNFAAAIFSLIFFVCFCLFLGNYYTGRRKILLLLLMIMTFVALLFTYSRSGYLMFAGGNGVILWLMNKRKYIVMFLFVLVLGIFLIPKDLKSAGVELWRTASIFARATSMQQALRISQDHPFFGVGFDTYRYAQKQYGFSSGENWEVSHSGAGTDNSFLFILVTTGIVGLTTYLYLLYSIFQLAWKNIKQNISVIVIASVAGLIIDSFFINSLFYPSVMVWLWIMVGLTDRKDETLW